MPDEIKRLNGPTRLVKNNTGNVSYAPATSTVTAVKHAIASNFGPWDAFVTIGVNDLRVGANLIEPSILVPAFSSVTIPLDVILDNAVSDSILGRFKIPFQSIYGDPSLLQTPAALTNGTGNAGAGSSVVTGSWTSVTGTLYMATVAWSKSTSVGTISSFTDTRGLTWTLVDTIQASDVKSQLSVYAAVATSAAAGTTTATFSASQDLSAIIITNVALDGTFDNFSGNGIDGLVSYGYAEDVRSTTTPALNLMGTGWAGSTRLISMTANGTATTNTSPTGWTQLNNVSTNKTLVTAHAIGSVNTAEASSWRPTLGAGNGRSLAIACEVQEPPRNVALSFYGVEVT